MHLIFNPFTTNENKTEIKSESNSWSKIYIKKEGLSKYHSTTDIKKKIRQAQEKMFNIINQRNAH